MSNNNRVTVQEQIERGILQPSNSSSNVFRDSFRREVNVGGEKYRVVVWVYN